MNVAWRIARRELQGELRRGLAGFRTFLLCLTLGVAAIATVGLVRASIEQGLAREGRAMLGGDLDLRMTYRFASDAERDWMEAHAGALSEVVDFRSMAVVGQGEDTQRALTQVKGVDAAWPLVGAAAFDPPLSPAEVLAGRDDLPGGAMEALLADRLGLAHGDRFRLGTQEFVLMATLLREPDAAGAGFGFGPRSIVATEALAQSGLLGPGTLFETHYRMTAPDGVSVPELRAAARAATEGAGVRIRDARQGAPGVSRFVERIGSFLILVGLAGLAVGGIGVASAVRAYLDGKTATIATLKTLGATGRVIFAVYFAQIAVLTLIGVAAGVALGALVMAAAAPLIEARLPLPAIWAPHPAPMFEAAIYGLLTALIFTLLPLARVERVRAAALFRGADEAGRPRAPYLAALVAATALLIGAAMWFAAVPRLALGVALGVAVALGVLYLTAIALRALARRAARARVLQGRTALRLALGAVGNPREGAVAVILALGLGLTVLATTGQIDANMRRAIAQELPERAPSFFFVDIQPDQMEGFMARLERDPGVGEIEAAPQLRGIITAINGTPARDYGDHWVLRGDRGVSYAATPPAGTRLSAGEWWRDDYAGPPLISFGADEAAGLGVGVGDEITVNILGRDMTGTIANLREVDFRSGGIGFVMIFDQAALQSAPHTWLATVHAAPAAEAAILRDIGNAYPNITAVELRAVAETAAETLGALARATSLAALATLATGFVVLIGTAAAGERARVYEAAVLKTLGATRAQVLTSFALRSALMGAAAGLVAVGAAALAAWLVLSQVLELDFRFAPLPAAIIIIGGIVATLLAGLLFALRPLSVRPARTLRARD
ncbi:MAG: FtsX-like permease family protein [Paracoccus sp. (in: a-proteobacteria)]|nr:FtsX-like permease family protein [Paracoccus sp. (in: a-proteobacteria)]